MACCSESEGRQKRYSSNVFGSRRVADWHLKRDVLPTLQNAVIREGNRDTRRREYCEAMAYAAVYMLGVHRIADSTQRRRQELKLRPPDMPAAKPTTSIAAMARLNMAR